MTSLSRLRYFSLILISVLIGTSTTARAQTPDAKSKATGSISGRATIGGKGASGIAIAAYGGDVVGTNRRAAAQAITDGEGRYRLFGLAAGTYQVSALAPNYASAEPLSLSSFGSTSGVSKSIVLAPAENVEDIDLKLVRGGVITGRVKDAEGKPVVEQRIALAPVDENGAPARTQGPSPFNSQMYLTDDRGVYRIYGLPAGHYKVSVGSDPTRGAMSTGSHIYYPLTFYGDVTDQAKAAVVELSEGGEAANIDIQVGRRGDTYVASGHIIDADSGQPIPGLRFSYGPSPKNQPYFSGFMIGVATNANGEFRIEGLEPGRYGVSVSSGFDLESTNVYSDPAFFEVTDGDVSNIEVKAVHGLSLSGVVVTDGITNKDVLAQLGSMRISASVSSTAKPQTFNFGSSLIAGDGSFTINGLRPGRAAFSSVGSPGVRGLTIARVEREGVDVTRTLELQAGQSLSDLRVVLIFGTGTIRGTVKFENGTPPPGSRVYISARPEGSSVSNYGAQLDSRGRFVMTNLAAGTYEVTLNLGLAGGPQPQRRLPPPKQFVAVAEDAEAEITFTVDLKPVEGGP
jgi:hypothetical protein